MTNVDTDPKPIVVFGKPIEISKVMGWKQGMSEEEWERFAEAPLGQYANMKIGEFLEKFKGGENDSV
jgi:hypothetical protein